MKRFFLMCILTVAISAILTYYMPKDFDAYVNDISLDGTVCIYCRNTSIDAVDIGQGKIVQCTLNDFANVIARCAEIDGLSVSFSGSNKDVQRLADLFCLKNISVCEIDDLTVVCGKSNKVKGGIWIDGVKINVQIAYHNGTVTVGSPLILGSY